LKSSRGGAHDSLSGWDFMQAMLVIEIEQRKRTRLTPWMGFHAGNVSDRNQINNLLITYLLYAIFRHHSSIDSIIQFLPLFPLKLLVK